MGTVGISFGSPTAGTGFDVSTTVSQIVANLQSVETPWKTQLAELTSQDTVISSLGTLLSTLSTDAGDFTDFQGVLATKQGSSSDTNVLQLTDASPEATAGTHTIVVNSLAATSSGFLAAPTSSTDTLSGSITITVGSGTAQTVTLDSSDGTLAGLEKAINSANIGVTAGIITDTTGSRLSLTSGTSGTAGALTVSSAIVDGSATSPLAYTSGVTAADASLTVDGVSVTTSSNTVSTVIPGVTFQLLAPSPTTAGVAETVQVEVLNDNSSVVSSLGQFVSDYNAVVSAVNVQETNNSSGSAEPLFGTPTLRLLQEQLLTAISAASPSGYLPEIPTANVSDTLTGTLTIKVGTTSTPFDLSTLGTPTLAGLAAAINTAAIGVTASVITDSTGSRLSLSANSVDSTTSLTVTSTVSDGTTALPYYQLSDIRSLTSLGISVNNDGTISLDTAALNTELNTDYSGIISLFQDNNSWGVTFSNELTNLGTSDTSGGLALALSSNSSSESTLNANISKEDAAISVSQSNLTLELTSADEILQAIPSNLDNINELYSAITGYNSRTSS
jgi:flagellar hook-associated protein 2